VITSVWAVPVDADRIQHLLSDDDRDRLDTLFDPADRNRFATGRALLRLAVSDLTGVAAWRVTFDATCSTCGRPHGRPVLTSASGPDELHLSVSHAGDRVVVAVSANGPVGVDVEPWASTRFDGFDQVALTAGERAELAALGEAGAAHARTELWVAKEAVLKRHGIGLDQSPETLHVGVGATKVAAPAEESLVDLVPLDVGPDYCARLAVVGRNGLSLAEHTF